MITAIVGAAAALGSAIYGGIKSSIANKRAQQLIQNQRDKNREWYNTEMSRDYTQRSDVQAAIKKQRELLNEQYQNARATNVVAGGTDEAVALQKKAANKAVSDTMTDVAAAASQHKDAVEQQYHAKEDALTQQQVQGEQQNAAQTAAAAGQAVNAGLNLMGSGLGKTAGSADGAAAPNPNVAKMAEATSAATLDNAQAGLDKTLHQVTPGEIPIPKKKLNA